MTRPGSWEFPLGALSPVSPVPTPPKPRLSCAGKPPGRGSIYRLAPPRGPASQELGCARSSPGGTARKALKTELEGAGTQGRRGRGTGPAPHTQAGPDHLGGQRGLPRARRARTFFRSRTWPVRTATAYILMTSSVLQSRKAGSTWPPTTASTRGGILAAGALGRQGAGLSLGAWEPEEAAAGGASALGAAHSGGQNFCPRCGSREPAGVPGPPLPGKSPPTFQSVKKKNTLLTCSNKIQPSECGV